jgi:pilus assembly protein CpaE
MDCGWPGDRPLTSPAPRILVLDRTNELAARLRHNVVPSGAVVKACPDAGRAEAHIAAGHWDVLVAGPSLMHRAGLRRLASLHARHPWLTAVLALHERPRVDLNEIVQVGASDLLPLHADDDELRRALQRAARLTRARLGFMTDGPGQRSRGRIVMVASASGGSGKTFLATNAAEFLVRAMNQPVVLVDLDLQFGEVSTALRMRPETTIIDALAAEAEGYDLDDILDDHLLPHPDGFKVLAAPRQPAEADSITPGDVTRLLDVLRARGAWVVIDTHEGLSDVFRAALEATDHVFAVATPDRPSLVNLDRYLGMLEHLGLSPADVSVVLNKAESGHGIPYSREVTRSINVGVPLIVGKPKSTISTLLAKTFAAVLPDAPKAPRPSVIPKPVAPPLIEPQPVPVIDEEPEVVFEFVFELELDLREPEGADPAQIDLREAPFCRGRAPPCPFSSRRSPGTSHTPDHQMTRPGYQGSPVRSRKKESKQLSGDVDGDNAPVHPDAHSRSGHLCNRRGRRPRLLHGLRQGR